MALQAFSVLTVHLRTAKGLKVCLHSNTGKFARAAFVRTQRGTVSHYFSILFPVELVFSHFNCWNVDFLVFILLFSFEIQSFQGREHVQDLYFLNPVGLLLPALASF